MIESRNIAQLKDNARTAIDKIGAEQCMSCGLCAFCCPVGALVMESGEEGFEHPRVIRDLCKDCGRCIRICPVASPEPRPDSSVEVYVAWSLRDDIRLSSSSGGLFTELAEVILKKGGVVCGAAFDKGFDLAHTCITSSADLAAMRGSKYLPSKLYPAYAQLLDSAKAGKSVLFCGTPCQCAAIERLAQEERIRERIVLCDLVCHGVPSPVVFDAYLDNQNLKRADLASVSFRDKRLGWTNFGMYLRTHEGREVHRRLWDDLFYQAFHRDLCLRDSCYDCRFSRVPRVGDLTLGDFWGCPEEFADEKGVSVVIVNTEVGRALLEETRPRIALHISDLSTAIHKNPRIVEGHWPSRPNKERFMSALQRKGFVQASHMLSGKSPKVLYALRKVLAVLLRFRKDKGHT
jgi:coenzyme F420-reducing hydrogenase beta subunit